MTSPITDERLKEPEILPCPHCGGAMKHWFLEGQEWWEHPTWSDYPDEGKRKFTGCPNYGHRISANGYGGSIEGWNRRAPSAELLAAREALKFYAEPTNYKGELVQGGTEDGVHTLTHHVNLVRKDGGQRARGALSGNRSGN